MAEGGINVAYLKSKFGILKILEFIFCLLAFSLAAAFRDAWRSGYSDSSSRIGFFIFVAVVAWIFALLLIIFNITGLIEKVKVSWKTIILAILHGVAAAMFLIAAALCADDSRKWNNSGYLCRWLDFYTNTTCATYTVSVVFGFICLILFAIDAVFHFLSTKQGAAQAAAATA